MASADSGTTKPFHVAIVGGGIGGLAFAIGLLQYSSHITFHIYEAAPAFAEIGAGVGFGNNSHKAIKLISPELWERYNSRATFNGWESKAHTWFDFQVGEKGENEGKRILEVQMEGRETQSTVHRAHFLEELISFIPRGAASFGKRCVGIEQPEGEQVIIKFADGSDARADAVVGCDGVRSAVRPLVLGVDNPSTMPVFTQKYAYRGLIPMDKLVEAVGDEKAKNRQMYLGHNAHILTFPIAKCTLANVVAFHGMKGEGEGWTGEWVKPNQKENMMNDFADFGVLPSKILGLIANPDVWALFEHPPVPSYHNKRVCLLGDAAHASTPHFGAGAGMALEDAYILSHLLGQCTNGESDITNAFAAYDSVRIPRTQDVVRASKEQGRVLDMQGKGSGDDLEKLAASLNIGVRWIWNEDLGKHRDAALDAFRRGKAETGLQVLSLEYKA